MLFLTNSTEFKRHVECSFDADDYMCGYIVALKVNEYFWQRKKADRDNMRGEPKTDGAGSEIGMYVTLQMLNVYSDFNVVFNSEDYFHSYHCTVQYK